MVALTMGGGMILQWLIVVVTGQGTLAPVNPGDKPFAMTNPIYLDVDGNGLYDAPKAF
jgi:hypothetical protein